MGLDTAAYNENCFNNVEGSYNMIPTIQRRWVTGILMTDGPITGHR
jgi:hypothetical protein